MVEVQNVMWKIIFFLSHCFDSFFVEIFVICFHLQNIYMLKAENLEYRKEQMKIIKINHNASPKDKHSKDFVFHPSSTFLIKMELYLHTLFYSLISHLTIASEHFPMWQLSFSIIILLAEEYSLMQLNQTLINLLLLGIKVVSTFSLPCEMLQ